MAIPFISRLQVKLALGHSRKPYRCPECRTKTKQGVKAIARWSEVNVLLNNPSREKTVSYEQALAAAGAKVLEFKNFGSYQGEWVALIFHDKQFKWVHGYFGSCSGCDAFEAEIGDCDRDDMPAYQRRLAEFGKSYLENAADEEELIKKFTKQGEWDSEANDIVAFLLKFSTAPENRINLIKRYLTDERNEADES